jgi:hypothetical protein
MQVRNARHFSGLAAFMESILNCGAFMPERIVAIGLLTRRDLSLLGPTFDRAWPVEDAPEFDELLHAIDDAERKLQRNSPGSERR